MLPFTCTAQSCYRSCDGESQASDLRICGARCHATFTVPCSIGNSNFRDVYLHRLIAVATAPWALRHSCGILYSVCVGHPCTLCIATCLRAAMNTSVDTPLLARFNLPASRACTAAGVWHPVPLRHTTPHGHHGKAKGHLSLANRAYHAYPAYHAYTAYHHY